MLVLLLVLLLLVLLLLLPSRPPLQKRLLRQVSKETCRSRLPAAGLCRDRGPGV